MTGDKIWDKFLCSVGRRVWLPASCGTVTLRPAVCLISRMGDNVIHGLRAAGTEGGYTAEIIFDV